MREKNIGEIIKQRRHELKMSVDTLAELIGKDRATIYRYEKNEITNIPINIVKSIAQALNMSINELVGDGISVGIGDDNEGETWTSAEEEQDVIGQAWADLCIPPDVIEQAEQVDIDLSYQSFKRLLREKMQCENRLIEINEELLLYRDTCNSILIDLKSGGMKA